jgi:magnesium-transporting ATPase (P-type)
VTPPRQPPNSLFSATLKVEQASLTGESESVMKDPHR